MLWSEKTTKGNKMNKLNIYFIKDSVSALWCHFSWEDVMYDSGRNVANMTFCDNEKKSSKLELLKFSHSLEHK